MGIDPTTLFDKLISNADWLSMYKITRVRGKVKIKQIRSELYDKCMMLHQKVFQDVAVNSELSVAFARAFAFENCKTALQSSSSSKYKVAWAIAAEDSIQICRRMGLLELRMQRFFAMKEFESREDSIQSLSSRRKLRHVKSVQEASMIKMQTIDDNEMGVKLLNTIQSYVNDAMKALSTLQYDFENARFSQAAERKVSRAIIEIRKK